MNVYNNIIDNSIVYLLNSFISKNFVKELDHMKDTCDMDKCIKLD